MKTKWPEKFDIVVANPPYSNKLDLKFLDKAFDVAKEEVVFVHPATTFVERKGVTKIYSDLNKKIGENIKSISLFNGNGVFEIGLYVPVSITHISKKEKLQGILIENLITNKQATINSSQIEDICYFGYDENFLSIDKKIKEKKTLKTEMKEEVEDCNFIVQMSKIMGNSWQGDKIKGLTIQSQITQPNFFCIVRKSTIPELPNDKKFDNVWIFNNEAEANNFISYCKTNFARMCLAIVKVNQNLGASELARVPWMDFTQEWTDEKLYAHFGITEEEQAFIKEVIPPYYD